MLDVRERSTATNGLTDLLHMRRLFNHRRIIPLGLNTHPIKDQYRVSLCIEVLERTMIDE